MEVNPNTTTQSTTMYDYVNNFFMTPSVFIIVFLVIIAYVFLFMSLGNSGSSGESDTETKGSKSIMIIIIAVFVFLLVVNGLKYFLGIDIYASVKNLFEGTPTIDIKVDESRSAVPEIRRKKQVFNIPGNEYGYQDAKALCQAYGARLANYNEIEEAYGKGAEWCNYGWSDGQMALFPTQKATFEQLQKIQGHENDCGRPGVNGGYMANPHLKFGVNCYGYKPRITDEEKELMLNTEKYPKTMKDIALEQRVEYWKNKITEILISPFNHDTWSKI